jgi:hypothetical protein
LDQFTGDLYQTNKEELAKDPQTMPKSRKRTLPNSCYKVIITLIPKLDMGTTKEENYRPISMMHRDVKFSIKYLQIEFNNILKDHTP